MATGIAWRLVVCPFLCPTKNLKFSKDNNDWPSRAAASIKINEPPIETCIQTSMPYSLYIYYDEYHDIVCISRLRTCS